MSDKKIECASCASIGYHAGRSICTNCHRWHAANGTLHRYPPLGAWLDRLARIEDFAELRAQGLTIKAAAIRVGVSKRSGERYEHWLRMRQAAAS